MTVQDGVTSSTSFKNCQMIIAPLRLTIERLENLESYFILDTPAEEDFDSIVHLASSICDTSISLISLLT